MKIYVLGNILVKKDSLPIKILPQLKRKFPKGEFIQIDPSENFTPVKNKPLIVLDAIKGVKDIIVFNKLDSFLNEPLVSLHTYGLVQHLLLLQKLNRLPRDINIIGVPPLFSKKKAVSKIVKILNSLA